MVLSLSVFAGLQGGMLYPKATHIRPTLVVVVPTRRDPFGTPGPSAILVIPLLLHPPAKPTCLSIPAEPPNSSGAAPWAQTLSLGFAFEAGPGSMCFCVVPILKAGATVLGSMAGPVGG